MDTTQAGGLSEAEIKEIQEELGHYQDKSAASIGALKIVQQHRGWVSDQHLQQVARLLDMSPAQLDSVATFYNLIFRRPVGKHVVLCCDSVSCWMLGAEQIRERISQRLGISLGETTADGEYTLLPIVCLGACDRAPVLMVDATLHGNVDEATLDQAFGSPASATQAREG